MQRIAIVAFAAILSGRAAIAQPEAPAAVPTHASYGSQLEGFDYPFPVHDFHAVVQGQPVEMAYMELAPAHANGRTVVLMHGKNFCAATWGDTARVLAAAGYRVIVPDQLGFCKSSKPAGFQYSMLGLAKLTADLLRSCGVSRATLVGHSFGGTLAIRMAIAMPQLVDQLVLIDPLALDDRLAQGVPYADVGRLTALEQQRTPASMKAYQLNAYYHGVWRKSYDRWVDMMSGMYAGPGRAAVVDAQARTTEMIESQPIAYELNRVAAPTVLMVGTLDHNVFGRTWAPPEIGNRLPEIGTVGDKAAAKMRNARFVPLVGLGHAPQIEDPARFQVALIQALSGAL